MALSAREMKSQVGLITRKCQAPPLLEICQSCLMVHIICGTIVSSIIIYVNEEFSQRCLRSQVANGQLNCLFRQLERLNILKVDGQLCNFLHCATKPNDKFNAPLVLRGEKGRGSACTAAAPATCRGNKQKHIETPLECVVPAPLTLKRSGS